MNRTARFSGIILALISAAPMFAADAPPAKEPIVMTRATGPIKIDGDLSDPAWKDAVKIDTWYETNPGDNLVPKVRNVGYLTFDDHFLYAAFDFEDPNPKAIRAPYVDHDNISQAIDYAGVIIDSRDDGKTAVLLLATPRGIQYDSVSDDSTGIEDSSPDFFWDSAAKINDHGWTLELRIPFSSLRYKKTDPMKWGIQLYRNYPRDRRYQYFSNKLPRGGNCFICYERPLLGMSGLPSGNHLVVAPYITGKESGAPVDGDGTPFVNGPAKVDGGVDLKWTPSPDTAIDATINPDFSQIESDITTISTNERFAIFYPEKRPFFLEGNELFNTPIQAVYTRTITSPRWGLRATGKMGKNAYTILVADDRGGGLAVIPGPIESSLVDQDFASKVVVARVRHDEGNSFVSAMFTDREIVGGGHNRVFGPDFQWRPSASDTVTGQFLYSDSVTPNRPDLAAEWDGRHLKSAAADLWWQHTTSTFDLFVEGKDFGRQFRADTGFVPQVGFRETDFETGYTFRPTGFFSRLRPFLYGDYQSDPNGSLIFSDISPGLGMDGKWASTARVRFSFGNVRSGNTNFHRNQLIFNSQVSPGRLLSIVALTGWAGQNVDFTNGRPGRGANLSLEAVIHASDHLELRLDDSLDWLNVDFPTSHRLFTAQVERLRATYNVNARSYIRYIVQNVKTNYDPSLFTDAQVSRDGGLENSVLFAYKVNWQTVVFVGASDDRDVTEDDHFEPSGREFFLKVSYAFQR